jgi:hypothetical protein
VAKIVPGPLVGEIRNKLGAQVFSRNAYGPYTKALPSGEYFETPARLTITQRMAAASTAWNDDLSDAQRRAWQNYADAIDKKLRVCGRRGLAGRPTFISAFLNLDNIGQPTLTDPPDQPLAGAVTALALTVNSDDHLFSLDGEVPPDTPTQGLVILASPGVSVSRNYIWPDLRQITALAPGWAFPLDLWAPWNAKFPLLGEPSAHFVVLKPIAADTGLAGVQQLARAVDQGSGGAMLTQSVVLTDAQIKALPTTPVEIVPFAPGKMIIPFMTVLELNALAGAYGNVSAGIANFISTYIGFDKAHRLRNDTLFTGANQRFVILTPETHLDAIPPTTARIFQYAEDPASELTQPLRLYCTNAAGAFNGGDAANTLTVTTYYQLLTPA